MSSATKKELTDEVLNKLIKIFLEVDDIKTACKMTFSKEDMRVNQVVKKYLDANMGDELRKCVYIKQCSRIRKECEKNLDEDTLISILRSILRIKKYKLIGTNDKFQNWRYVITPG